MTFLELLLLSVGLSMDAFAVSICKGLAMRRATLRAGMTCGIWFGGFQALMPLIGFYLGMLFADLIQAIDHWVAFILLGLIGANMLKEGFSQKSDGETDSKGADMSMKTMFLLAIATSIDALAVGISLAMAGNVDIWTAIAMIGIFTCFFCTAGVKIGNVFGNRFEDSAQIAGGIILILLGVKILLEHLGYLG
ncbi:MAG: manganese efflux pump MntP family protein [Succiniclasticum sp.]|uniref:manganese efflux pump MntP n=1 Tax=Succiniclasticum sp. TaxID=2775030 RepID=UPI002A908DCF|nr:manganese efflux pump MntP family protein [Succiniclasticum sp.]MDY6292211.1 manganese efflux pump MntP family protein [Succiniclasticum sp.]